MKKILPIGLIMIAIFAVGMLLGSSIASADLGPKVVRGYIRDNAGNDLQGASVTINIRNISTNALVATLSDPSTDEDGFYSVSFGPPSLNWAPNYKIEVIATYNSAQETNITNALNNVPVQWVNVTYPYEIPELGSWLGFAIAGCALGAVAVVILVRKKH